MKAWSSSFAPAKTYRLVLQLRIALTRGEQFSLFYILRMKSVKIFGTNRNYLFFYTCRVYKEYLRLAKSLYVANEEVSAIAFSIDKETGKPLKWSKLHLEPSILPKML
jgi:hypothetical protein